MDTLITLQEASRQYNIPLPNLRQMARDGKIWSAKFNGEVMVAVSNGELKRDEASMLDDDIARARFAHLKGEEISISEAARRYKLSPSSLSYWAQKQYIKVLRRGTKEVFLDEADVAYAQLKAQRRNDQRRGKPVFGRRKLND